METELKLTLVEQDLPRLLTHPLLATGDSTQRLLNTYFDTPDLALQQRRMAVRERLAGAQWLLTVKTAGQSEHGLSRRTCRRSDGAAPPFTGAVLHRF